MNGIILHKGEQYYTYLNPIFDALDSKQLNYNWLLTECDEWGYLFAEYECVCGERYVWISGAELTKLVKENANIQMVWGVLSAFDKKYSLEEVLQYPEPYADMNKQLWVNPVTLQHPLAYMEIVAFDSSCTLVKSIDVEITNAIKKAFPNCEDLEAYNSDEKYNNDVNEYTKVFEKHPRSIFRQLNRIQTLGVLLIVAFLIFMSCNAFLYKDTIARVIKVENTFDHEEYGPNEEIEKYYDQQIIAVILNGARKGDEISLTNTYSASGINDERYRKGNQLFVTISDELDEGQIIGMKRDWHLAFLICLFVGLLLFVNKKQGGLIAVTLLVNIAVFVVALQRYGKGADLVATAFFLMLFFSVLTLLFAGGFQKKTLAAIFATLLTTFLCFGIYEIVLNCSDRLSYEMMDYVVNPTDLPELFLTGVLMGSLGAVMDVTISIAAGVAEIKQQTPDISTKDIITSVREMGYDIMGTMINVLFFTYISGAIPIVIIKIMNGYTLYHLVHFHLAFEIIRFLVGAIGIVLAIPVSGLCSVLLLHKWAPDKGGAVK